MMDVIELRTRILSALVDANITLGTYTYEDGSATPALWVDEGKAQPGEGQEVSGLEIQIYINPQVKTLHLNRGTIYLREWLVILTNNDVEVGIVEKVLKAMSKEFVYISEVNTMRANADGILEKVSFLIPD